MFHSQMTMGNIDLAQNQKKRSDGWLLPRAMQAKSFALLSFHMVLTSFDATSFLILPSNLVNWFFCQIYDVLEVSGILS